MKTKTLGILTITSLMLAAGNANANMLYDIYAGGTFGIGGYTLYTDNEDNSYSSQSYGAILGMDMPLVRIELEYNYLKSDEISANLGIVNLYFKLPTPVVKPYIGAGLGVTSSSKFQPKNAPEIDIDDTTAYQGMLGITLDLPVVPFDIDVEGRALYAPEMFKIANHDTDMLHYEGRVKLRYIF